MIKGWWNFKNVGSELYQQRLRSSLFSIPPRCTFTILYSSEIATYITYSLDNYFIFKWNCYLYYVLHGYIFMLFDVCYQTAVNNVSSTPNKLNWIQYKTPFLQFRSTLTLNCVVASSSISTSRSMQLIMVSDKFLVTLSLASSPASVTKPSYYPLIKPFKG